MELDHLFFLTTAAAPELAALNALGLTPTYRRTHAGQGTSNVCYAFANAFLEVLWVTDVAEAQSAPVARLQLDRRSAWTTAGTSPFGIAWRATAHDRTVARGPRRRTTGPLRVDHDDAQPDRCAWTTMTHNRTVARGPR